MSSKLPVSRGQVDQDELGKRWSVVQFMKCNYMFGLLTGAGLTTIFTHVALVRACV